MSIQQLDFIFPFVVLAYGLVMALIFETPVFNRIAEQKLPAQLWQQVRLHRRLAWVCLFVGGAWSVQNILFG